MASTYTAQFFFDGEELRGPSRIDTDDGVVVSITPFNGTPDHFLLSPGFIDLQMNGFGVVDVATASAEEFAHLDTELLRRGTTSWLGTVVTAPLERLSSSLNKLHNIVTSVTSGCVGFHAEGPFLGRAPGAHNPEWLIPLDKKWCDSLPSSVKLITVAPEQKNVLNNIEALVAQGVVVSLGHTRATSQQFNAAVQAGASMVTHLFNGMSGVHHRDGGIALWSLVSEKVVTGLIADMVHVSPEVVKLAFAAKGGSGVCLVSDSVAWMTKWATERGIRIVDGAPRLPDGTLAGSSTPLAECVRHVVQTCGVSVADALTAATRTPATVMGFPQMGTIKQGQRADIVLMNDELSVVEARRGLVSIRA